MENHWNNPIINEMSKNEAPTTLAVPQVQPQLHEASLGQGGSVIKGRVITPAEAEVLRRQGRDVVVCGPDLTPNRTLAREIEHAANGRDKCCGPPGLLPESWSSSNESSQRCMLLFNLLQF